MDRYIGLDAHAQSCTVAVMGPTGKRLREHVVDTAAPTLVELVRGIAGDRHLCFEEGALSEWLYETLEPHVTELVVMQDALSKGNKSDALDAWQLADRLRTGGIARRVFKAPKQLTSLRRAVRAHLIVTRDVVRTKNRLHALYRSRGIQGMNDAIYDPERRKAWLKQLPPAHQKLGEILSSHLDAQRGSLEQAENWLREEARRNEDVKRLATLPGIAEIRAAQIVATVITPHRFRTKQQFWSYCGLGIVMRSSSDWQRGDDRRWERKQVLQTRGLTRDRNALLKEVFSGAARTVLSMPKQPLFEHYTRMTEGGTKPNLARLTVARRIAAATLAIWKRKETYDPARSLPRKDAA